jgi:hypothetical protein
MSTCKFLRRKAASEYLRETHGLERAPSTLAKLAVLGGGPAFRRVGRVPVYTTDDLDEWVVSKLSPPMRSTSEAAALKGERASQLPAAELDTAMRAQVKHRPQANPEM